MLSSHIILEVSDLFLNSKLIDTPLRLSKVDLSHLKDKEMEQ
jgi:hypothetical protein